MRILTPKRSTDVLAEVRAAKARGQPYSITFVGVNGVGKSTNLAKIAYWLIQNGMKARSLIFVPQVLVQGWRLWLGGKKRSRPVPCPSGVCFELKGHSMSSRSAPLPLADGACTPLRRGTLRTDLAQVMMAACDTFRAGAVEQLKTHCSRLQIPLFERGYEKDPAKVAQEAIAHARRSGIDVVLVDTAGRMQVGDVYIPACPHHMYTHVGWWAHHVCRRGLSLCLGRLLAL